MATKQQVRDLVDMTAYDRSGAKVGRIGGVYYDNDSGEPLWVTVHTGLFGMNESFVPLEKARYDRDDVRLAYDKDTIKDAPNIAADGQLSAEQEADLYRYYRMPYTQLEGRDRARRGRDGRSDRPDGDAMTRSEERLHVGTETREVGRARLRKHVVTEHQEVKVPVAREELRIEREPITDANRRDALRGPDISEAEHEVTLHEERPVVSKETVPVEQVRLGTEKVTGTETVGGEVRKERIDLDEDDTRRRDNRRR
jgi:uncharacterized protein (TIGR02271 family)